MCNERKNEIDLAHEFKYIKKNDDSKKLKENEEKIEETMNSKTQSSNVKETESKDEPDHVQVKTSANNAKKDDICMSCKKSMNPLKKGFLGLQSGKTCVKKTSLYGDCEVQNAVKSHLSALEKFHYFISSDKTPSKDRPKLIKSKSLARLFGNNYSTKKSEEKNANTPQVIKPSSIEKFHNKSNEIDSATTNPTVSNPTSNNNHHIDVKAKDTAENSLNSLDPSNFQDTSNLKALRLLSKGLGKLLRRNCDSLEISKPDSEYKVKYLGNVLTGFAKGDACTEKPLATLWSNFKRNNKPEVQMLLKVCSSGLKASTRQHGLTEYWSHRVTYCAAPKNYPRVFCWIYRHEGRKLKHELRCHAVYCSKDSQANEIATVLKQNLAIALREFKRDKICRQNARLSLANSVYDNPSMPRRKILLSTGANNYKPPLERSKSAPKLMAIEEIVGEEEEETEGECGKKQDKPKVEVSKCCKEDYLYPSITLGRRRCRRGHSFKRSLLRNVTYMNNKSNRLFDTNSAQSDTTETVNKNDDRFNDIPKYDLDGNINEQETAKEEDDGEEEEEGEEVSKQPLQQINGIGSDEDFESFLLYNDYDSKDPLTGDFMSYFDMKLTPMSTISAVSLQDITNNNLVFANQQRATACISLDNLADYQTYSELDGEDNELESLKADNDDDMKQHFILSNKNVGIYDKTDRNIDGPNCSSKIMFQRGSSSPSSITDKLDSDESSISSGYQDDLPIFPRRGNVLERVRSYERMKLQLAENDGCLPMRSTKYFQRGFSNDSSRSFPITDFKNLELESSSDHAPPLDDCDSDESGYVEFQDLSLKSVFA